ncbi:MAG TPA: hypothetical protein VFB62_06115, partial [Polyangiaceae bacterium]|nr:hypothetical protein [Polyangiaceae bacterium]
MMRLLAVVVLSSGCSLIRDLDYLGSGAEEPLPDLCPEGGWCVLPDTKIRPECPDSNAEADYAATCWDVVRSHNGGVYDHVGHRLVIWGAGSGQTGHKGNEVYALSLTDGAMRRLTDPSSAPECVSVLPDGTPHPRSTRGSLAFTAGGMLAVGGEVICGGFDDTWFFDLTALSWTNRAPLGPDGCDPLVAGTCHPSGLGEMTHSDPVTGAVFVKDTYRFWRYDGGSNRYEQLRDYVPTSYAQTASIDPDRRLFVYIGCDIYDSMCVPSLGSISIDPDTLYANSDWTDEQTGCEPLMESYGPGFVYDARQKVFVGWPNKGDTVYVLDPATKQCTPRTFPGGPPPAQMESST